MTTGPGNRPAGVPEDARSRSRPELLWYLRHADALARWPVIDEAWARRLELRRGPTEGPGPPRPPR